MSDINQKKTAERIKGLRMERNWTQEEVADRLQGSPKYYCGIEKCKEKITPCYIKRLAKVFNVEFDDIAVYENTHEEQYHTEIQRIIAFFAKKYGLTFGLDLPPKDLKELMSTFPTICDVGIAELALKKLGYESYIITTKWNNDIVTLTFLNSKLEWDMSEYPKGIKDIFKDEYVWVLIENNNIVGILNSSTICDIDRFVICGVKGIIDGARAEHNILFKRVNLSEKQQPRIKVVQNTCSFIGNNLDLMEDLLKQVKERINRIKSKTDNDDF